MCPRAANTHHAARATDDSSDDEDDDAGAPALRLDSSDEESDEEVDVEALVAGDAQPVLNAPAAKKAAGPKKATEHKKFHWKSHAYYGEADCELIRVVRRPSAEPHARAAHCRAALRSGPRRRYGGGR